MSASIAVIGASVSMSPFNWITVPALVVGAEMSSMLRESSDRPGSITTNATPGSDPPVSYAITDPWTGVAESGIVSETSPKIELGGQSPSGSAPLRSVGEQRLLEPNADQLTFRDVGMLSVR